MSQNPYREGNLSCIQHPGCSKTTLPLYGYRSNRFRSMAPTPSIAARPCIPRISDATGKMAGLGKNIKRLYPTPRRPWRHSLPTGPVQACKCQVSHSSRRHPACSARLLSAGQRGKESHNSSTLYGSKYAFLPTTGARNPGPVYHGLYETPILTGDISKVGSERAAGCTYVRNYVQYSTVVLSAQEDNECPWKAAPYGTESAVCTCVLCVPRWKTLFGGLGRVATGRRAQEPNKLLWVNGQKTNNQNTSRSL